MYSQIAPNGHASRLPKFSKGHFLNSGLSQTRGKREDPKKYRNRGPGTSSLRSTALRSCIWHFEDFEPNTFEHVDWPITKIIYERLLETDTLSLLAWRLLRAAYPNEVRKNHHITLQDGWAQNKNPHLLPAIISFTASLPLDTLTILGIREIHLCPSDLMALLSLPNLAVLHLHQQNVPGHPDVPLSVRHRADEAHIRTCGNEFGARFMWKWGRAVQEKKAFQKLKVVGLERFRVWEGDLLRGLSLFPALSFLAVRPAGPFMIYENGRFESIESTVLEKWARLPSPRSPTGYCTDDWVESMVQATWVPQRDDFPGYDRADLSFLHNVFSRIDMTVTEKYREWYDAACVRDLQPKLGPDSSYVSILYKSPWDSDNDPDDPEYLVYNRLPDRAPSSSNSKKRPDKNEASEGNKRRVRGGRNKDIGALLGDFS